MTMIVPPMMMISLLDRRQEVHSTHSALDHCRYSEHLIMQNCHFRGESFSFFGVYCSHQHPSYRRDRRSGCHYHYEPTLSNRRYQRHVRSATFLAADHRFQIAVCQRNQLDACRHYYRRPQCLHRRPWLHRQRQSSRDRWGMRLCGIRFVASVLPLARDGSTYSEIRLTATADVCLGTLPKLQIET